MFMSKSMRRKSMMDDVHHIRTHIRKTAQNTEVRFKVFVKLFIKNQYETFKNVLGTFSVSFNSIVKT